MRSYWLGPLPPFHVADGAAFSNFTTFQDISPAPAVSTLGPLEAGMEIELFADGEFSNTGTPTLGLGFFYGTAAVALAAGTALTTVTAATSWPWWAYYKGRIRTVGTSGTINGQGRWGLGVSLTAFSADQAMPATLAARTVTIDTTVAKVLGVGAVWGTASASNAIKVNNFSARIVN